MNNICINCIHKEVCKLYDPKSKLVGCIFFLDFEKEYMKHYRQGRKDERAIINGELLQSFSDD